MNLLLALLFLAGAGELEGEWRTRCVFVPKKHSALNYLKFSGGAFKAVSTFYGTQGCADRNFVIRISGSYREVDSATLEYTMKKVQMRITNKEVAAFYREHVQCGYKDWKVGAPRNVSGRQCGSLKMPTAGKKSYDLFRILRGELAFGVFPRSTETQDPKKKAQKLDSGWTYMKDSSKQPDPEDIEI